MPNNQSWFGDNRLLSLYMGLNHPQKLFLMQGRALRLFERTQASDGTLDGEPLGSGDVCLHLKKKSHIKQLSYESEKNDSSKIAK